MRIFLITVFTLIATGVLILTARIWGLGQSYALFEHSFLKGNNPIFIAKVNDLSKAAEVLALSPQIVLWLDVRFSRDKVAFILPKNRDVEFLSNKRQEQESNPSKPIMISGKLSEYPFEDIKSFYKDLATVAEFYSRYETSRFVLNIVDNVSDAHIALTDTLAKSNPNERTLIQSEALILMTSIKELKPQWVYGTSIPDLVRLLTFDSMYILPTTQFKGDVFVAPFKVANRRAFNEDIILEMRRRNKKIFLGPIEDENQLAEARRLKADGYITEDIQKLVSLLGQGPAL
jgi:hypothetical protein